MTDNMKKFAELLSADAGVKKELETAAAGLGKDDKKGFNDAAVKVAARHGITLTAADFGSFSEAKELSADEMRAVAGGKEFCVAGHWFRGECELEINW